MKSEQNVVVDMLSEQGKKLDTLVSNINNLVNVLTANAVSPVAVEKKPVAKATAKKTSAKAEANDFLKAKKSQFESKLSKRIAENPHCPQGIASQVVASPKSFGLTSNSELVLAYSKSRTRTNARALIKSVGFKYDYDRKGFYKD